MTKTTPETKAKKRELVAHWKKILESNRDAVIAGEKARNEREGLILEAAAAGVSKTAIHQMTGISRTAIYNILNKHKDSAEES